MNKQVAREVLTALRQVLSPDADGEVHEMVGGGWVIGLTTKDGQWMTVRVDGVVYRPGPQYADRLRGAHHEHRRFMINDSLLTGDEPKEGSDDGA